MAGSYILYKKLHHNGLMTDLGLPPKDTVAAPLNIHTSSKKFTTQVLSLFPCAYSPWAWPSPKTTKCNESLRNT